MRLVAYEYRLCPTAPQKMLLDKHFGAVRWIYNQALEIKSRMYKELNEKITAFDLNKGLTEAKKSEYLVWLKEVNTQSLQSAIHNLDNAFTCLFKKRGLYPQFKKKSGRQSFQCPQHSKVDFGSRLLFITKFREGIPAVFHRQFEGKIKTVTIKKTPSNTYYASVLVETPATDIEPPKPSKSRTLGIDVGLKNFLTTSDGKTVTNPKIISRFEKKLAREQRRLSRKLKGSKNRDKQRVKVARVHERIANARKDFLHKVTHDLVKNQDYDSIAVEDLAVKSLMMNRPSGMAKAIGDAGWGEFFRQLDYKCRWHGKNLLTIGRFDPSSKLCPCGHQHDGLKLSDREWDCPRCGAHHDRDKLATENIRDFAIARYQNELRVPYGSRTVGRDSPKPRVLTKNLKTLVDIGGSSTRATAVVEVPVGEARKKVTIEPGRQFSRQKR